MLVPSLSPFILRSSYPTGAPAAGRGALPDGVAGADRYERSPGLGSYTPARLEPVSQDVLDAWLLALQSFSPSWPAGQGRGDLGAAAVPAASGRELGALPERQAAHARASSARRAQRAQRRLSPAERRTARFIDRFLEKKHSPAAGRGAGAVFVRQGKKSGVSPLALLGIAGHETGYGRLGVGLKKWLGVGAFDSNPDGRTPYDGMKNQIRYGAETFKNLRRAGGSSKRDPLSQQLRAVNRAGWATDPNWHQGVARHVREIRGAFKRYVKRHPLQRGAQAQAARAPKGTKAFRRYAAIVRRHGGQVCPHGQATVLGLRHYSRATQRYDDRFVVLRPNGTARIFKGATHPGQSSSSASPDVNGDGAGDVGIIRPGNYVATPNGPHAGAPSYYVRTRGGSGSIPGWRDTNHDGRYSTRERRASRRRGDALTEILFHQGNASSPSSIGCQTLAPDVYQRFMRALGGSGARFTYTLVNA